MGSHRFDGLSNWLVPGKVMQGEHPLNDCCDSATDTSDSISRPSRIFSILEKAGCRTFVCLQAESAPCVYDSNDTSTVFLGGFQDWKTNSSLLKPYKNQVVSAVYELVKKSGKSFFNPSFIHYGIRDFDVVDSLEGLSKLIDHLGRRVREGEILYIHCLGGKGRSGLVSACLLGEMYGFHTIEAEEALKRVEAYANLRLQGSEEKISSPETHEQKNQVKAFYDQKRGRYDGTKYNY